MSILNFLRKIALLRNIKYLLTESIRDREQELLQSATNSVIDYYKYWLKEDKKNIIKPNILNYMETVELLKKNPKSFIRYGDGELQIMIGERIPFQKADEKLAMYLKKIIKNEDEKIYVGLPYMYFNPLGEPNEHVISFIINSVPRYRKIIFEHCNINKQYIDTGFTQLYMNTDKIDFLKYFNSVKSLFKNKDVVIFAGKGILNKLQYDVFEEAKSKEIVDAPAMNAFSEFDNILRSARKYSKDKLLCFILGPTSKALVYELAHDGYCAWDVGHLAKDYDAFMSKIERSSENVHKFFSPD